ncbi:tRNA lysidine(34) synthetase TilS, partial [Vibrio parahaemolyticus]|nr:tRNA lysidine(34) synthetase TilS [Vibrio parahaemolyticus]
MKKKDNNSIIIQGSILNEETPAIRNRIIRKAIFYLCDDIVDIDQKHIEMVSDLLKSNTTGKSIDIGKSIKAKISYGNLHLQLEKPESLAFEPRELSLGENLVEELNLKLNIEIVDLSDINYNLSNTKYFDYDKIKEPIIIRTRKNGDVFYPLGLNGKKKIKK